MAAGRSKIPVAVGIVGPGLIGSTLIKQLSAQVHLRFGVKTPTYTSVTSACLHTDFTQLCVAFSQARALQNNLFIDMHIVAIISTRAMFLYNQKGCDMETWQTDMAMGVSHHTYACRLSVLVTVLNVVHGSTWQSSETFSICNRWLDWWLVIALAS